MPDDAEAPADADDAAPAEEIEAPTDVDEAIPEEDDAPDAEVAPEAVDELVSEDGALDLDGDAEIELDGLSLEAADSAAMSFEADGDVETTGFYVSNRTPDWGDVALWVDGEPVSDPSVSADYPVGATMTVTFTPKNGATLDMGLIWMYNGEQYTPGIGSGVVSEPYTTEFELEQGSDNNIDVSFTPPANGIVLYEYDHGTVSVTVNGVESLFANPGDEVVVTATPDEGYCVISGNLWAVYANDEVHSFEEGQNNVHTDTVQFSFTKADGVNDIGVLFIPTTGYAVKLTNEADTVSQVFTQEEYPELFVVEDRRFNFIFPDYNPGLELGEGQTVGYRGSYYGINGIYYPGEKTWIDSGSVPTYTAYAVMPYAINYPETFGEDSYLLHAVVDGRVTQKAQAGDTVWVDVIQRYTQPDAIFTGLSVYTIDSATGEKVSVTLSKLSETYYSFTMPASDVEIIPEYSVIVHYDIDIQGDVYGGAKAYIGDDRDTPVTRAAEGDTISLVYSGNTVGATVSYGDTSFDLDEGVTTFTMPAENVTVTLKYIYDIVVDASPNFAPNGDPLTADAYFQGNLVTSAKAGDEIEIRFGTVEGVDVTSASVSYGDKTINLDLDNPVFTMPKSFVVVNVKFSGGSSGPSEGGYRVDLPPHDTSRPYNIKAYVDGEEVTGSVEPGTLVTVKFETDGSVSISNVTFVIYDSSYTVIKEVPSTQLDSLTYTFTMPEATVNVQFSNGSSSGPSSGGQYPINIYGGSQGGATALKDGVSVRSANAGDIINVTYDGGTVCVILSYKGETYELPERTDMSQPFSAEFTMPDAGVDITVRFSDGTTSEISGGGSGGPSGPSGPSGPAGTPIIVNDENFPDKTFQEILKTRASLQGSDYVIYSTSFNMIDLDGVKDFTGLEKLTSLIRLVISNAGETVTLNHPTLGSLMFVNCEETKSIDLSGCPELKSMNFEGNMPNTSKLDVSGCTKLTQLLARGAALTELDVSKNTELIQLDCNSNKLTSLDVSNNTKLTQLSCFSNPLTQLDISGLPGVLPYVNSAHASDHTDEEKNNYIMYSDDDGEYVLCVDKNVELITEAEGVKVVAPTAKTNLNYNGEVQTLIVPGSTNVGEMQYRVEQGEWSAEVPTAKDSGSYMIDYRIVMDDPEAEAPEGGTLLVGLLPKELSLNWTDTEFTYDGEAHEPTVALEGVIGEDDCTAAVSVDGEAVNVGTYTATASLETGARNYMLPVNSSVEFQIVKGVHDPVTIAEEDAPVLSAKAEEALELDLTKYLSDTVTWSVKSQDGLRVLNAWPSTDETKPYTLLYTTLAPSSGTETGEVVIVAEYDNYEDLEITVPFGFNTEKHTLAFVTNGAGAVTSRKLYEGEDYGELPELSREGYSFDGWYTDEKLENKLGEAPVMGAADTQIYAKWIPDTYTVSLALGELNTLSGEAFTLAALGVEADEIEYTVEDEAFELPVPKDAVAGEKTYTFTGWLGEGDSEPQINVTVDPSAKANASYTAQWVETKLEGKVSFSGATETLKGLVDVGEADSTSDDGSASRLANAMKEIAVRENASTEQEDEVPEAVNVIVTMEVSADEVSNVGKGEIENEIKKLEVSADNTDFLEIKISIRSEDEEGNKIEEISGAIEDTKRAVEIPIQYSLVKGDNPLYDPIVLRYHGDSVTAMTRLSSRPAEGSYEDNTYYVDNNGADSVIYVYSQYFSTFAVAASETPSYYVTFESNGGDAVAPVKVTAKEEFKLDAPEITRAEDEDYVYSFDGWFTDAACEVAFEADQEIKADTKLYAKFSAIPFVNMVVKGVNADYDAESGISCDYEGLPVGVQVESAVQADIDVYYALEPLDADNYTTGTQKPYTFNTAYTAATVYWYAVSGGSSVPRPESGSVDIVINVPLSAEQTPAAKTLSNTGALQPLVNAPAGALPEGYTAIEYSIDDGATWSAEIPKAKDAGTYTVRVKYVGDDDHEDFEIAPITVTIPKAAVTPTKPVTPAKPAAVATPAPVPAPTPTPTISGVKKSNKATVFVGTVYQIDLAGQAGKSFKSSNKKVAAVTSTGLVTPKKAGKCKITFKVGKKKRTITLKVKDPTIPTAVYLNLSGTVPAQVGVPQTLTVTLPQGTVSGIKWTSSNKKIATVKNGVVTFKKAGKVTITATASRGKKKAKVKFKVTK